MSSESPLGSKRAKRFSVAERRRWRYSSLRAGSRTRTGSGVGERPASAGWFLIDENDMVITFAIPANGLVDGNNTLRIEPPTSKAASNKTPADDIRVGQVEIRNRPVRESLREATLVLDVVDADSKQALPCRITVLDAHGAMQTLGAESNDHLAVRPGMAFSSAGHATIGVPAGRYTIFAGRGFEYSLARVEVTVAAGETAKSSLTIRREVPTEGYVACDTHVHTLTHSGHGDATIEERMITLAGEGIELPIATDHNKHIDYEQVAARLNVRRYFTPVMGSEVTRLRRTTVRGVEARLRAVDRRSVEVRRGNGVAGGSSLSVIGHVAAIGREPKDHPTGNALGSRRLSRVPASLAREPDCPSQTVSLRLSVRLLFVASCR